MDSAVTESPDGGVEVVTLDQINVESKGGVAVRGEGRFGTRPLYGWRQMSSMTFI